MTNEFPSFDPLDAKQIQSTEVAALAQKRELKNILNSYVGWFDPFCELIQNSLDSIEKKMESNGENFKPHVSITVDLQNNSLIVSDNGFGLDEQKFNQFLCPNISFKTPSKKNRGHKGVGATYIAYGFNDVQVSTKTDAFKAVGRMRGARDWLDDESPSGNPKMYSDHVVGCLDETFESFESGVSIFLKFDKKTHPADLGYYQLKKPSQWFNVLRVKTGLGAFYANEKIAITIIVIDKNGKKESEKFQGISYLWPEEFGSKTARLKDIFEKQRKLFESSKDIYNDLPSKLKNVTVLYDKWDHNELLQLTEDKRHGFNLDEKEIEFIKKYEINLHASYVNSTRVWKDFSEDNNFRTNSLIIKGGIQICANNMPQGEIIQIPLNKNIGRQNQLHCVFHFDNCSADLGRKGFNSEITDIAKVLARKIADGPFQKGRFALKPTTGTAASLKNKMILSKWKDSMIEHEQLNPLELLHEHFFLPQRKIAITSLPTREQDVIALFHQLIAGGVIRGLRIMATNERTAYDGLYRVVIEDPGENHLFDEKTNPLGILEENMPDELPIISAPQILEYKFNMDALIEDLSTGDKNSNDVDLLIVWESGKDYEENYKITSLIDPDNLNLREYHGVTHIATNLTNGQREFDIIILSELLNYLNRPEEEIQNQIEKYEISF